MNLLRTKYYPVDVDGKTIYIDPKKRERDVADQYGRGDKPLIGLSGARLMDNKCYHAYQLRLTVFKKDLLAEWEEEERRSRYLWQGAARIIHDIIRDNDSVTALRLLREQLKSCGSMGISSSYERAVNQVRELVSQESQASQTALAA